MNRRAERRREDRTNHARPFSNILLHELTPADPDELAVRVVRDGPRQEGLSSSRRAVEEDSLRLGDTEGVEELRVLDGELDDLLDLLDLLVQSSDHLVRRVGNLLDHHEGD